MTKKSGSCPICKSASAAAYLPFCSKRCADIDLGRWLKGGYAIAGGGADTDDDSTAAPPEVDTRDEKNEPRTH